jgi:Flp pilus assembly protein TadD
MSDADEWLLVSLDEKIAQRQGVPARVPVPKLEYEGLIDKGLQMEQLKKWIGAFLQKASSAWRTENAALATSYDRFMAKVDFWVRAQNAFNKSDFKTAISSLKMVSNVDPSDHAAKMNLASALAATSDFQGALKLYEIVRPTFEGDPEYYVALANVHLAQNNPDAATTEFVLAIEAKPDHQGALDGLRALGFLSSIYEDPRDATSLVYVRTDALVEYLEGIWEAAPRDVAYFMEQYAYHASEKRHAVALAASEKALVRASDDKTREVASLGRIASLRAIGKIDDATSAAREFITKYPTVAQGEVELAECLAKSDGNKEAVDAALDRALALDPGNLTALDLRHWPIERGDIALIQAAIPNMASFAEAHADLSGPWRSLARAKMAVGSTDEGLEIFAKASQLSPSDDELRAEYWSELARTGRFEDVLKDAASITDISKRDWKLRWNEAEAFARAGKKMEARTAFTAINHDESLHVDVRRRAKRAVGTIT